jgi:DNA-binding NarL/FixJ family response regulator
MESTTATELWRKLELGSWSVVERIDRDHTRYLLATENEPEARKNRALTQRERQVVEYASLGASNKVIAYELGVATSTISTHLSRAATKLGLRTRTDVIQAFVALRARTSASIAHVRWSGKRFAILAVPLGPAVPASLSGAERHVVELVLAGKSNAAIAAARGVSPRTVENQLASVMRKLGATSRADLTARLMAGG